jgi:hypothetical protein
LGSTRSTRDRRSCGHRLPQDLGVMPACPARSSPTDATGSWTQPNRSSWSAASMR